MAQLRLNCFHALEITLDGRPVAFRSNKGRALLIYLAVEQGRAHQRTTLAGLLWPDRPESQARQNLSQTLLEVRKAIGDQQTKPRFFAVAAQTIAFQPQSDHWIDAIEFERACVGREYRQATTLYDGDFLADFSVFDSDLWEAWAERKRAGFRQQALDAFFKLGVEYEQTQKFDAAVSTFRRLLTLMPWHEEAHCALMRLLVQTGQRSAALAQYETLTALLMDEFGVPPAGETDALYDQILAGTLPSAVSPPVQPAQEQMRKNPLPPPFQAPPLRPHFVGRADELQTVKPDHQPAGQRIYAIVGMGGVGKTCLATQMAHTLRSEYHDGVLWASPHASNALDILASWATAYGHNFNQLTDLGSRAAAVRALLAERQALIVIDNVARVSAIESLLPNGGACTLIITTRDLDVATALNAETIQLHEFAEDEALALLRQIIGDVRVAAEVDMAVALCTRCGHLPLAVEIAAQRLKSRPRMRLAHMVERLSDQEQRMALSISDRAVRTSFEVSWDGLDGPLQTTFAALSLFGGRSFAPDAVAHLLKAAIVDVQDQLFGLEALSLVYSDTSYGHIESHEDADNMRYRQHPLLADFAAEKLAATQLHDQITIQYADYFYTFAKAHAHQIDQLAPEWENILDAMTSAQRQQRTQLVVDYARLLTTPWQIGARYRDARTGLGMAQAAAQALGDEETIATLLLHQGEMAMEQSDYLEAAAVLEQSLRRFMHLEADAPIARVYYNLAIIDLEQGRYARAEQQLNQSLALFTLLEDAAGMAKVQLEQARIHYELDRFDLAATVAEEAQSLQKTTADPTGLVPILRLLSLIMLKVNEIDLALRYGEEARQLCQATGNQGELAATCYELTVIHRFRHEFTTAMRYAREGYRLYQHLGLQRWEGMILLQLGRIHHALGEDKQARDRTAESIQIFERVDDPRNCFYSLLFLSDLYADAAWAEKQQQCLQAAKTIAEQLEQPLMSRQIAARLADATLI